MRKKLILHEGDTSKQGQISTTEKHSSFEYKKVYKRKIIKKDIGESKSSPRQGEIEPVKQITVIETKKPLGIKHRKKSNKGAKQKDKRKETSRNIKKTQNSAYKQIQAKCKGHFRTIPEE